MDDEDIGSEWGTLKNVPKQKVTPLDTENLQADIHDARYPHPDHIYRVHEGYGLTTMALWRARCFYKRVYQDGWSANRHVKEVFVYAMDKLMFAGPSYVQKNELDGRRYTGACKSFQVSVEDAIVEWERVRQKHIESAKYEIARHRKEAEERLKWAADTERLIKSSAKLTVADFGETFRLPFDGEVFDSQTESDRVEYSELE